jgi:photosystem II stability/assembly factor-like uncharacterized protein
MTRSIPLAVALALSTGPAWSGPGVWTTTGPEGGDAANVVVDALAPDTLLLASRGGMFRSTDAGTTWSRFEDGLDYRFPYAFEAATSASRAFVSPDGRQIFRSSGGAPWQPTALSLASGDQLYDISLLSGDGQNLVLSSQLVLRRSADGGATATTLAAAGLPTSAPRQRIEYASATRLYVAFSNVPSGETALVWRSDDGGASFVPTADLPPGFSFLDGDLESAPSNPDRVYVFSAGTMFVSSDGGASWNPCDASASDARRILVEAGNPDHLWATGARGVLRSTTACASWSTLSTGLTADGTRIAATASVALAPGFPADDRLWVGTDFGGVFRSEDAGASFSAINSGMIGSNIRAIALHPTDGDEILLGYGDAFTPAPAIQRSSDDGATWSYSNAGMRATQIRAIAIDPTTASLAGGAHVYAVGSARPQDEAPSLANTDGGIYKSTDGGASWSTIDNGLPPTFAGGTRFIGNVRSVALDPRSCAAPPVSGACTSGPLRTLYVGGSGRPNFAAGNYVAARIYKSTDAGASWSPSETGLPATFPVGLCSTPQIVVPLIVDPNAPDTLYAGLSMSFTGDPTCPEPTLDNGIFKSTDGGATWVHSSNGLPRLGGPAASHWSVLALALDPDDGNVLYAGAYEQVGGVFVGRVFKSVDAGANWTDISVGIAGQDVRALLVDPADSNVVYAGTGGSVVNPSGVYKSTDGGLTWNSFSIGLPADAATALALDPHDANRLFAGTPGGLWEYSQVPDADSDGASTTIENAAPNGGDADASGTPDALESDVASFQAAPDGVPRGTPVDEMLTLELEGLAGNCTRINNAHALPGPTLPADLERGVAPSLFDRGVLRFELPDCERARVIVTLHDADYADVDWTWRNYGPLVPGDATTMAWYGFEGARKLDATRWELIIDAAERGNYRDAPRDILFVGGPGFVDLQIFGSGFDTATP